MKIKKHSSLLILLIMICCLIFLYCNVYSKKLDPINFRNSNYNPYSSDLSFKNSYTYEWNTTWGGTLDDRGRNVIIDSKQNIYVSGYYRNSVQSVVYDVFLVKYDKFGTQLWNVTWGGSNSENQWGIALDSSNNVYITGETFSYGNGRGDIFLIKYNEFGIQQWITLWGYNDTERGNGVVIDSSDNIFVVGYTDIDHDPGDRRS